MGINSPVAAAGLFALPAAGLAVLLVVLIGAGANAQPAPLGCGTAGTATTIVNQRLDAEQLSNAQTIVTVTASRRLPAYAAIIAAATAYQESKLRNVLVELDHDSEGLFQLRVGLWTKAVADDPVRSTNWFLDRLAGVANWQTIPLTVAAQAVQHSAYPDAYAPWQSLATGIVGQLWPAAAEAAVNTIAVNTTSVNTTSVNTTAVNTTAVDVAGSVGPNPTTDSGSTTTPAGVTIPADGVVCPGAGGGIPVAGGGPAATTVPAGLSITGSPAGIVAVRFALAQLGKPYLWGAAGPGAYDCSGLTMAAWATAAVALPHFTGAQVSVGIPEPTNLSSASAGDLVFIPGTDGTPTNPGHEGMVVGSVNEPDGRHVLLIQAPHTGAPVQLVDAGRWAGQIVAVRHIA
jgi:cell wall-associated NlpC family hydrolase